jgi:hypothetical protein
MLRLSPYYSSSLPFLFIFQLRLEFAGFFFLWRDSELVCCDAWDGLASSVRWMIYDLPSVA